MYLGESLQHRHQPLGFPQIPENAEHETGGIDPPALPPTESVRDSRDTARRHEKVWDLDHTRVRRMNAGHARGGRIVHHHGARPLHNAPQHRVIEIAAVGGRRSPPAPQFLSQSAIPLPVVVYELRYVGLAVQLSQQKMMQHRVMQHHHSRYLQRALVNIAVERVVAQMIERHVAFGRR